MTCPKGAWSADLACPYPAGATEYPTVTDQDQCKTYYQNFVNLGDYVTSLALISGGHLVQVLLGKVVSVLLGKVVST